MIIAIVIILGLIGCISWLLKILIRSLSRFPFPNSVSELTPLLDPEENCSRKSTEESVDAGKEVMDEKCTQFLMSSIKYSRLMSAINDENIIRQVVQSMKKRFLKPGDNVIKQGDTKSRSYYILESGAVDVFVFDKYMRTIQTGWCFGELAFVFGAPRSASCIATSESIVWELDRSLFDTLVNVLSPKLAAFQVIN